MSAINLNIEEFVGEVSDLFYWTLYSDKPIIIHSGGTSSTKTYSICQYLLFIAATEENRIITIVGQDVPNLRAGPIRDCATIVHKSHPLKQEIVSYSNSLFLYKFKSGSVIEFKSFKDKQDAQSGKRDYLFINEALGISEDIYTELSDRTSIRTLIDFNPASRFWVYDLYQDSDEVDWFISNFNNNRWLSPKIRKTILKYKETNPYRWRVYGLGLLGQVEGNIFQRWTLFDNFPLPEHCERFGYGLDPGYTNNNTALTMNALYNGKLYTRVYLYENRMNDGELLKALNRCVQYKEYDIVIDSAADEKADYLINHGYNIERAKKGPNSVIESINVIEEFELFVHRESDSLISELENYRYKKDRKSNRFINKVDESCVSDAIDSLRYWAHHHLKAFTTEEYEPE